MKNEMNKIFRLFVGHPTFFSYEGIQQTNSGISSYLTLNQISSDGIPTLCSTHRYVLFEWKGKHSEPENEKWFDVSVE